MNAMYSQSANSCLFLQPLFATPIPAPWTRANEYAYLDLSV